MITKNKKSNIPVVILAGGRGSRLEEETKVIPKPLVKIGSKPILYHIMKIYSHYGYKNFYICTGYKNDLIEKYFKQIKSSKIINNTSKEKKYYIKKYNWHVNCIFSGKNTLTGERLLKLKNYLNLYQNFFLTYGDGVAKLNIKKLLNSHIKNKKIATVTAVNPPGRYGILKINNKNNVKKFLEKVDNSDVWINGGFFCFQNKIFKYLKKDSSLEFDIMKKITNLNQLNAFKSKSFWKAMDTLRDKIELNKIYKKNKPWD